MHRNRGPKRAKSVSFPPTKTVCSFEDVDGHRLARVDQTNKSNVYYRVSSRVGKSAGSRKSRVLALASR